MQEGLFKDALKALGVTVTPTAFNAGPDAVTALFARLARHHLHRPEPDDQRLRRSPRARPSGSSPGAASGGAALVVSPDINERRGPQGQEARHAAARQHPGRRAALLAQGAGPDHRHRGWRRRLHPAAGQRRGPRPPSRAGQIDGAWVPEPWVSRVREARAPRSWSTRRPVAGRQVRHHEHHRAHRVPRSSTPTSSQAFLDGHVAGAATRSRTTRSSAKAAVNAALQALTGVVAGPEDPRQAWTQVEFTADPLPATLVDVGDARGRRGAARPGRDRRRRRSAGALYDLTCSTRC